MRKILSAFLAMLCAAAFAQNVSRQVMLLDDWRFTQDDNATFSNADYNDKKWEKVCVPHDWAVKGPFDKTIDMQNVAIEQNGEKVATEKTGRSGSLPWIGAGWYRRHFKVDKGYAGALLHFDGAMSEPQVYVNGKKAGEWKYGYNAFIVDITPFINKDGADNVLAVRLENLGESSRWYPGGGLYRPVTLIMTGDVALHPWGICANTTEVDNGTAYLDLSAEMVGNSHGAAMQAVFTLEKDGKRVADVITDVLPNSKARTVMRVDNAKLWSPETPELYDLVTELRDKDSNSVLDRRTTRIGIRTISITPEHGFQLNGQTRKFKGVCLHHDLGMLGSAVNKAALARQILLLKSMGCDAIRTSHNMPSTWQMDLCDSLGMMVMAESFDEWIYAKCKNGYHRFFDEWVEADLTNLVLNHRNHPSIVMWSIGNEVPAQSDGKKGPKVAKRLQNIVHKLDGTRMVTVGMDRVDAAVGNGYAAVMDVPGLNYRTEKYDMAFEKLPQGFILGSETASTVSSRGVYKFPVQRLKSKAYSDGQCTGYDMECCSWSNLPDDDFLLEDDRDWTLGQFVWTGFDYLGEPTPYDTYWPSRSSYFGIFDLAGLPKDRYWLYRSKWNADEPTIHLLPHWTWTGKEGMNIPVYCYTNCDEAELFVNGESQGRIRKNKEQLLDRYRLRWNDVKYQPGELKVVVYGKNGEKAGEQIVRTAGKPDHIELIPDHGLASGLASYSQMDAISDPSCVTLRRNICADGQDIVFVTARIVDKDGNLCPDADNALNVKVSGQGRFRGICNGDATSLEVFTQPHMKAFHGMLVIGVQSTEKAGEMAIKVTGKGVKPANLKLSSHK